MDWSNIKYFKESEFACKHCGECHMDFSFVEQLDVVRSRLGSPIKITSGYRCPEHNMAVSSTGPDGPHTTGKAADVQLTSVANTRRFLTLATDMFDGIGVNQKGPFEGRFIHIDNLGQRVWSY